MAWAAATPQLAADHLLVRYGDFSYGVFLIHVPLLRVVLGRLAGRPPTLGTVAAAGLLALIGGLMYGRVESAVYRRLRGWLVPAARRGPAPAIARPRAA